MNEKRLRFLLLEDDPLDAELITETLAADAVNADIVHVSDGPAFEKSLAERFDLILADYAVPGFPGTQALAQARKRAHDVPFMFVSGAIGEEQAIELLKLGATDYVLKSRLNRLAQAARRALDEANERRERRLAEAALFELASVGLGHLSADGQWLRANDRLAKMLGLASPEALVGRHFLDGVDESNRGRAGEMLRNLLAGQGSEAELHCARPDRESVWAHVTMWASRDEVGQVRNLAAAYIDISERKRQERRLWEAQTQMRLAAKIAGLGYWEWNPATAYLHWSNDWKSQLGYGVEELALELGTWETLLHPDDRERTLDWLAGMAASEPRPDRALEFRLRAQDGTYRWVACRGLATEELDGRASYFVGSFLDITTRKVSEERIRQLARHDALTGLPNRALVIEFGERLLAAARRNSSEVGVLILDLDGFKPIVDNDGNEAGGAVLREVAQRLLGCVRAQDLVGRLGGDAFVMVLADIRSSGDAAVVARHAMRTLGAPCRAGERMHTLTASIGIGLYPGDGAGMEGLIRSADAAMYQAKQAGGNAYRFFTHEFNLGLDSARAIEQRLNSALEQNEFELHYQPVINTETGAVTGAEALLRWPAANAGPQRFLPVAEAAGRLQEIEHWVLNEACHQQVEWRAHGLPAFPVTVNVSQSQFRRQEFVRDILDVVRRNALDGADLHLDLANGVVMSNLERLGGVLEELRQAGVKVALDDVGPGNSNLACLSRLPIDIVKIDRAFVKDLIRNPASAAVAEAIIALARSLGCELVAEGVESQEMADFLYDRQCRHSQGFHFCPPLPGGEFEQWYRRRSAPP